MDSKGRRARGAPFLVNAVPRIRLVFQPSAPSPTQPPTPRTPVHCPGSTASFLTPLLPATFPFSLLRKEWGVPPRGTYLLTAMS